MQRSGRRLVDLTRALAFIASCATALTSGLARATAEIDAQLVAVSVEPAGRDLVVYPLPSTLSQFLPIWHEALEAALTRARIFSPTAPRRLSLSVKVLEFSLSGKILTRWRATSSLVTRPLLRFFERISCPTKPSAVLLLVSLVLRIQPLLPRTGPR